MADEKKASIWSRFKSIENQSVEKKPSAFDENSDGYISAREAINALDQDTAIEALAEDELIAQQIQNKLNLEAEFLVIRVKKSRAMLALGVLVLLMWLVPLSLFLNNKYNWQDLLRALTAIIKR